MKVNLATGIGLGEVWKASINSMGTHVHIIDMFQKVQLGYKVRQLDISRWL